MKRVIISDLHIGSKHYKAKELLEFLSKAEYDELILAGDVIDFIKIPYFTEYAAKIFEAIDWTKRVIYVVGNHDISFEKLVGMKVLGIEFVKEYCFEEKGRRFKIEHGDKYDKGLVNARFLMELISIIHDWFERKFNWDLTSWYVNYKLKKRKLIRIWDILKRNEDVDVLIMGHSHCPEAIIWVDKNEVIKTYVNCGDWVSSKTWVSIEDGEVRLRTQKIDSLSLSE